MGSVKDRHLKYEIAGDDHVGRVSCGLNQLSTNFSTPLPCFKFEYTTDSLEVIETKRKIENWLKRNLNDSENTNPETLCLVWMLYASLYNHRKCLMDIINQENTLYASYSFKDVPEDILACTTIRHSWDTTTYTPNLTGTPPHVSIIAEFE